MRTVLSLVLGVSVGLTSLSSVFAPQPLFAQTPASPAAPQPMNHLLERLANTEWLLEDLAGTGVVDRVQTTLRFNGTSGINGSGGCNRYFGGIQGTAEALTVGAIASTRMMCPPAVMNQEMKFFQALRTVNRIELGENGLLYLYPQDNSAPLRFSRLNAPTARPGNIDEIQTLVLVDGKRNVARVFLQGDETRMNVYDKQTKITWTRGTPVDTRQTPEGTFYTNRQGEVRIEVFVPASGGSPTLSIDGNVDR